MAQGYQSVSLEIQSLARVKPMLPDSLQLVTKVPCVAQLLQRLYMQYEYVLYNHIHIATAQGRIQTRKGGSAVTVESTDLLGRAAESQCQLHIQIKVCPAEFRFKLPLV